MENSSPDVKQFGEETCLNFEVSEDERAIQRRIIEELEGEIIPEKGGLRHDNILDKPISKSKFASQGEEEYIDKDEEEKVKYFRPHIYC